MAGRETIEGAHLAGVRAIAKMLTGIEEVIHPPLTSDIERQRRLHIGPPRHSSQSR
jgi:hypothetical protein